MACSAAAGMASGTAGAPDPARLPIGDGRLATGGPQRGYVYACRTGITPPGGRGAFAEGPWIRGDGTFDLAYGPRGAGGRLLTDADLDACHGRTGRVWFEGRWLRIYHYNATLEYPCTLGCFHGTPVSGGGGRLSGG